MRPTNRLNDHFGVAEADDAAEDLYSQLVVELCFQLQ